LRARFDDGMTVEQARTITRANHDIISECETHLANGSARPHVC